MRKRRVIIVGRGPAGLACAITLRRHSFDVTILESKDEKAYRPGEHVPSSALRPIIDLGVSRGLISDLASDCWEVRSCWGSSEEDVRDSIFEPHGTGLVLSRLAFDAVLSLTAVELGVRILHCTHVFEAKWNDREWQVCARRRGETHSFACDFIVDASGRNAPFSETLGARSVCYDRLVGLSAFLEAPATQRPDGYVLVEAAPDGWWYSARLTDHLVATFMTDGDLINRKHRPLISFWNASLDDAPKTRERLYGLVRSSEILCRPAQTQILYPTFWGNRLAIGDAASSFDPLSSQGISKGINDGIAAASAVRDALDGDREGLRTYAASIHTRFRHYLMLRQHYYRHENPLARSFLLAAKENAELARSGCVATPGTGRRADEVRESRRGPASANHNAVNRLRTSPERNRRRRTGSPDFAGIQVEIVRRPGSGSNRRSSACA